MMPRSCKHEPLVAAAARSGIWPATLKDHIATCPACSEIAQVAQLFQRAATLSAAVQPPPPEMVWRSIASRRPQVALRRATRSITIICALAALYAVALAAWSLPPLLHQPALHPVGLDSLASSVVLIGLVTAVVAVALGSGCLILLGRRTSFRLHS